MDNPQNFQQSSDFSSSGNDNSVILTLTIPTHSVPYMADTTFTTTVAASSSFVGRQLRAAIQSSHPGSKLVPSPYCAMNLPITGLPMAYTYGFADVTRAANGVIQLRVRIVNSGGTGGAIGITGFTVTARVRTLKVD